MKGGDVLSGTPGVPVLGQSEVGATDFDWAHSKLRERLSNNPMPPGWLFDIIESVGAPVSYTHTWDYLSPSRRISSLFGWDVQPADISWIKIRAMIQKRVHFNHGIIFIENGFF